MAVAIIVLIIISSFIIFILIYRKQGIVKDSGINKIIFFSIGIGIYFLSNVFIGYSSYMECSLYFSMKHVGIILFLIIFYIYIVLGYELGAVNIYNEKFKIVSSFSVDSLSSVSSDTSIDNIENESTGSLRQGNRLSKIKINHSIDMNDKLNINEDNKSEKRKSFRITKFNFFKKSDSPKTVENNNNGLLNRKDSSLLKLKRSSFILDEESKRKYIDKQKKILKRNIKNAHNLFLEISIAYPIILVFIILLIIFCNNKNKNHFYQSDNEKWYYKCDLETPDIIYDSIELLFLIIIILKGKIIHSYECIFKCTKYITYSSIIGIVLGPLVNVKL